MRLCLPSRDDFVADFFREGNIHQRVAVDVTDLAFADAKFRAAETVRWDSMPSQVSKASMICFEAPRTDMASILIHDGRSRLKRDFMVI